MLCPPHFPFEPGGSAVRLCSECLAAGEGVFDAPAALQERGGAEGAVVAAMERLREGLGHGVLQSL
jgi:hypothetical protein